jgi:hypothetical protein
MQDRPLSRCRDGHGSAFAAGIALGAAGDMGVEIEHIIAELIDQGIDIAQAGTRIQQELGVQNTVNFLAGG